MCLLPLVDLRMGEVLNVAEVVREVLEVRDAACHRVAQAVAVVRLLLVEPEGQVV